MIDFVLNFSIILFFFNIKEIKDFIKKHACHVLNMTSVTYPIFQFSAYAL